MLPVFVISLTRATERRADIGGRLKAAGVAFEFVDAVDGAALDLSQYQHRITNDLARARGHSGITTSGIGNFLSHYGVWQRIADEKIPFALILEDDCVWDDGFFSVAQAVTENKHYWNIVHLSARRRKREIRLAVIDSITESHQLVHSTEPQGGTDAYLIDRDGAEKMLAHHRLIRDHIDQQWKRYWESGCYFYYLNPRIARQHDLPSDFIHGTEIKRLRYQNGWWRYQWGKWRMHKARRQFDRTHPPTLRTR